MKLNNIPDTLRNLYMKLVTGSDSISKHTFIEAMEKDYPQLKKHRLTKEAELYLDCLDTALRQVNPKYDTDQDYIYFTPSRGGHVHTKDVYDWFEKLCARYSAED